MKQFGTLVPHTLMRIADVGTAEQIQWRSLRNSREIDWFLAHDVTEAQWSKAFQSWRTRMQRCIDLHGDYVE